MRCHSVVCGMTGRVRLAMQSDTYSIAADQKGLLSAFTNDAGNVIETHEHAGGFKEW